MKNKYIYLLILFLAFYNTKVIAQISREKLEYFTETKGGFSLESSKSNCYCNTESNTEELPDISFGYDMQAALAAQALIQQARDRALNQWFDRQHTVLKNEIEKQLFKPFTNYNEARNTYFKHIEAEATRKYSRPISDKYQSRYLDKANGKSISINNLKLLQLRENELKVGNINNSSYANFTFNGTQISQIKSIAQLQTLWKNELTSFSNAYSGHHNDYYTYLKIREVSSDTDYNSSYILELLNKQLANYNQYDRWQQLNLMQSYLNKILPPLALPSGYINPKIYATPEFIENYAIKNRGGGVSIFDDAYIDIIFGNIINSGAANSFPGGPPQIYNYAKGQTENLRKEELNRLLNEVSEEDLILQQFNNSQAELETLYNDNKIRLKPNNGKINNRDDQKYTHYGTDGVYGYYKMEDGSTVISSPTELSLNSNGKLVAYFTSETSNDHYWYIKPEGNTLWSNYLIKTNYTNLAHELEITAKLSLLALGKAIGTYVLPIEDTKIIITGTDFDGEQVSRLQTAGFMIVGIVPGGKLLEPLSKGSGQVWKVVIKNGDNVFTRTVRELTEETIQHFDNYVEGATNLLQEALRKGDILDDEIIIELGQEIADLSNKKGRKLTWEEVKALFKRRQDFNKKASNIYEFNEVTLKNGKRLDSYIPGQEIISRKATTLTNIKPETFKSYLQELINKYPKGAEINAPKFGNEFLNKTLDGDYFLEIPSSNQSFFENSTIFQQVLNQFNVDNNVLIRIKYLAE
jgi:hypothetical protein